MWNPRNILGMAALAALFVFSIYFQRVRDKAQQYDATVALLQSERETFAAWKTGQKERDEAALSYQSEISSLRADLLGRPVPVIRLCPQPAATPAPSEAAAPRIDAPAAAAGGVQSGAAVPERAGADIGPQLQQLFARSDEVSAQLRAVLQYMGE